jgi:hypothetical protein
MLNVLFLVIFPRVTEQVENDVFTAVNMIFETIRSVSFLKF